MGWTAKASVVQKYAVWVLCYFVPMGPSLSQSRPSLQPDPTTAESLTVRAQKSTAPRYSLSTVTGTKVSQASPGALSAIRHCVGAAALIVLRFENRRSCAVPKFLLGIVCSLLFYLDILRQPT